MEPSRTGPGDLSKANPVLDWYALLEVILDKKRLSYIKNRKQKKQVKHNLKCGKCSRYHLWKQRSIFIPTSLLARNYVAGTLWGR